MTLIACSHEFVKARGISMRISQRSVITQVERIVRKAFDGLAEKSYKDRLIEATMGRFQTSEDENVETSGRINNAHITTCGTQQYKLVI